MDVSFFPGGRLKKAGLFFLFLAGIISTYSLLNYLSAPHDRLPASETSEYELLKACEKQDIIWEKIVASTYKELPPYQKLGLPQLVAMARQGIQKKGDRQSDFAPESWVKYLHRRGSIAKVKIVPVSQKYTGVFEGAECAILRLSLTYRVTRSKPVAPGLALKVFRDRVPSANVSALVSLNGQGKDYNFFKHFMSNIVPEGNGIGQKLVHKLFRKVTRYPEELLVDHMASIDSHGEKVHKVVSPRQLFFVPAPGIMSFTEKHDVRMDFHAIPEGKKIYELRALPEKYAGLDYSKYTPAMAETFVKESEHIADIVTTSEFLSSSFGDDGIFFRHELRP